MCLVLKHAWVKSLIRAEPNCLVLLEELPQLEYLFTILKHDIDLVNLAHDLLSLLRDQVLKNLSEAPKREYVLPVLRVEHELAEDQLVGLLAVLEDTVEFLLEVDELVARPVGHPLVEVSDLKGVHEQVSRQSWQEPDIFAYIFEGLASFKECSVLD